MTETNTSSTPTPEAGAAIRSWLLDYAWTGTLQQQAAEVDCIMAQDGWQHLGARVEQLLSQSSGENSLSKDLADAEGFALSALYECHDGPHQETCPSYRPAAPAQVPA